MQKRISLRKIRKTKKGQIRDRLSRIKVDRRVLRVGVLLRILVVAVQNQQGNKANHNRKIKEMRLKRKIKILGRF